MNQSELETKHITADFCVVGGGMAGLCAALSAARHGVDTVLIQDRPVLGGNASSEIRMHVCGAHGPQNKEGGILEELMLENIYTNPMQQYNVWDHVLYGKCLEQGNLRVLLNCPVFDLKAADNRIDSVTAWHMHQQCFYTVTAELFSDCSGDSVLRTSGAEYRWGREAKSEFDEPQGKDIPDRKTMGNSILIQLRGTDRHVPFRAPDWAYHYTEETLPNRGMYPATENFWWIEIGGSQDTIADADEIRDELLKTAYGVWEYIKNHPDGRGHNWELAWIGSVPGKRENVRYVGDLIMTQHDIEAHGRFEDIVAYGGWTMDDHHPDGIHFAGQPTTHYPAPSPYGIPYRALYSKNIENLFFAGRNISATHMAMSSTRVMATCAIMGEAVGVAAALAAQNSITPRGVYKQHLADLQTKLMDQDCYLPWHKRELNEPCRNAALSASEGDPEILRNGIERDLLDSDNGWWCGPDGWVQFEWDAETDVEAVRIIVDSDFTRNKRMPSWYEKDREPLKMPGMMIRDADIELRGPDGAWRKVAELRDNRRRYIVVPTDRHPATGLRLRVLRSWDGNKAHVFSVDTVKPR